MRWDDLYIAGTGVCLPDLASVEQAIADGAYDAKQAAQTQQLTAAIAPIGQWEPDLAVGAARQAMTRAGLGPEAVGLVLYAVVLRAGIAVWNAASYVQRHVATPDCISAELRSGCDGALVALELASSHLHARPGCPAAIVTAADCWHEPVIYRWRNTSGTVFADGGAAAVITRHPGFARVLSLSTASDPDLEGLERGNEPFGPHGHDSEYPVDLPRRAREFLTGMPKREVLRRYEAALQRAVAETTEQAGMCVSAIRRCVLPWDGAHALERDFLRPLGIEIGQTTWEFDRRIGHLGAGGPLASLDYLVRSGDVSPGDHVLVIGKGAGFVVTAAVIEIVTTPPQT